MACVSRPMAPRVSLVLLAAFLLAPPLADAAPGPAKKATKKKPGKKLPGKKKLLPSSQPSSSGPPPATPNSLPPGVYKKATPKPKLNKPKLVNLVPTDREVFTGASTGVKARSMWLPGFTSKQLVKYEVIDGMAIVEGDIALGPASQISKYDKRVPKITTTSGGDAPDEDGKYATSQQALGIHSDTSMYWEDAQIPYELRDNLSTAQRQRIAAAIEHLHQNTNIRLSPRAGQDDYVVFKHRSNTCSSPVGRQGGKQIIHIDGCVMGSIVHEILHSAGVWHEQSRNDRAGYVSVNWGNIKGDKKHNFEKRTGEINDIGPYDYGSIMHYGLTDFGKPNPAGSGARPTLELEKSYGGTVGQRSGLSPLDIEALNHMYPVSTELEGGDGWGGGNYTTSVAFGNVDSDVRDEFIVVRRTDTNARLYVYDDAAANYTRLLAWGGSLPSSAYAVDVAVGNVDNDAPLEIGVALQAPKGTKRVVVLDDRGHGFAEIMAHGVPWGTGWSATAIAFGDVDADGRDEVIFGRKADKKGKSRWYLYDDATTGFNLLDVNGKPWGDGAYVKDIATGDIDGDGRDEIAIARRKTGNVYSLKIFTYNAGSYTDRHHLGQNWGAGNYVTSVAMGDIDGDGRDEIAYTRKAPENHRWRLLEDAQANFIKMTDGGSGWGDSNYGTSVAFGDVDGDGREELGLARKAGSNSRYWVFDDHLKYFNPMVAYGGTTWGSAFYATTIAFGDTDNDGEAEFGIGRKASANKRYAVYGVSR